MPETAARLEPARTYIDVQRRLWPELVRAKFLPPATQKVAAELADQFRDLFRGGGDPLFEYHGGSEFWTQLGAAYLRYGCDNSNPRSLDQQLKNVLERAARDRVFIPWVYVFADAAVSGTAAARRGYQLVKAAVRLGPVGPHCVYVDEVCRAAAAEGGRCPDTGRDQRSDGEAGPPDGPVRGRQRRPPGGGRQDRQVREAAARTYGMPRGVRGRPLRSPPHRSNPWWPTGTRCSLTTRLRSLPSCAS